MPANLVGELCEYRQFFSTTSKISVVADAEAMVNQVTGRIAVFYTMVKEDDGEPGRAYPIAEYIANLLDGVFVPTPLPQCSTESDLLNKISNVLKETGEAIDAVRQAGFERERNTLLQRAELSREINEAIVSLLQLKDHYDKTGR